MSANAALRVEHSVDDEAFALVSESYPEGTGGAVCRVSWSSKEEMDLRLATATVAAEKHLAGLVEKATDMKTEAVAGMTAPGAKSQMSRVHLPFGYEVFVGRFSGHDYDEVSLVVGPVKLIASLKPAGGIAWKTLRAEREKGMLFGVGDASRAFFVGQLRHPRK